MAPRPMGLDRRLVFRYLSQSKGTNVALGAEEAATDGGMLSSGVDLGYLGVYGIWFNDLGKYFSFSLPLHFPAKLMKIMQD